MNYLNGGYVMIKHNASQKDLADAYKSNKPVLVYDENQKAHWCQINEKVIETTDEETQETITTYEYSYQLLNDIATLVDSAGNLRFIEGNGEAGDEITGLEITYCKWSLSGTHLMLVCCGTAVNGTELTSSTAICNFKLPTYILSKIVPVWSNVVENKAYEWRASDWSSQASTMKEKLTTQGILLEASDLTLTKDRAFRVQFDLLIDAEYTE